MTERQGSIYVLCNVVNGKEYVGQTIKQPASLRWDEHLYAAFVKNDRRPLYRAIRKSDRLYGDLRNFTAEVVWVGPESKLNTLERTTVRRRKTFIDWGMGYNLTTGGDYRKMSKRSINKLRESLKAHYANPEARDRQRRGTLAANVLDPLLSVRHAEVLRGRRDTRYTRIKKAAAQLNRVYTDDQRSAYADRASALHRGKKLSAAHCANISKAQRGKTRKPLSEAVRRKIGTAQIGKVIPQWQRDKISKTLLGNIPWNKGRKLSAEHCAKLSASHKGIRPSEATRLKMSAKSKGHPNYNHRIMLRDSKGAFVKGSLT